MGQSRHSAASGASRPGEREPVVASNQQVFSFYAALAVGAAAPAAVALLGSDWLWLGLGAASWFLGVALKIPLSALAFAALARFGDKLRNACLGIVSGACELGVAAAILVYAADGPPAMVDLLLFGLAAGATELLVLAGAAFLAAPDEEAVSRWEGAAQRSLWVRHTFFIERMIALVAHTGSRGLAGLVVVDGAMWAGLVAMLGFAVTDGVASYGQARGWDWSDPVICRRAFTLFAVIAAVEMAVFAAAWTI
jgi:hypothetical protein